MKGNLMEMINHRMHSLLREAGFIGTLIIEELPQWDYLPYNGPLASADCLHLKEPTEYDLMEIAVSDYRTIIIYY